MPLWTATTNSNCLPLFDDLFQRRNTLYRDIVQAIANAPLDLDGLYTALNIEKTGKISEYVNELALCGFITREHTWKIHNGVESKLSRIRLNDNYLRFYIKAITCMTL